MNQPWISQRLNPIQWSPHNSKLFFQRIPLHFHSCHAGQFLDLFRACCPAGDGLWTQIISLEFCFCLNCAGSTEAYLSYAGLSVHIVSVISRHKPHSKETHVSARDIPEMKPIKRDGGKRCDGVMRRRWDQRNTTDYNLATRLSNQPRVPPPSHFPPLCS